MNNRLAKARKSDKIIFASLTYEDYPDILFTAADFARPVQIARTNP